MSDPIGPGDWVECVSAPNGHITGFRAGGVYKVSEAFTIEGRSLLNFAGMPKPKAVLPNGGPGWFIVYFRPLYTPKADLIESLLNPVEEEVA